MCLAGTALRTPLRAAKGAVARLAGPGPAAQTLRMRRSTFPPTQCVGDKSWMVSTSTSTCCRDFPLASWPNTPLRTACQTSTLGTIPATFRIAGMKWLVKLHRGPLTIIHHEGAFFAGYPGFIFWALGLLEQKRLFLLGQRQLEMASAQ